MKDWDETGKARDNAPFAWDQKNAAFRKQMKIWREQGFSKYLSRHVAHAMTLKPKASRDNNRDSDAS